MDKNKIQEELKNIITVYVPEKKILDNLTLEHDLINDLKINSAHIVDIVLDVEEKYDTMLQIMETLSLPFTDSRRDGDQRGGEQM